MPSNRIVLFTLAAVSLLAAGCFNADSMAVSPADGAPPGLNAGGPALSGPYNGTVLYPPSAGVAYGGPPLADLSGLYYHISKVSAAMVIDAATTPLLSSSGNYKITGGLNGAL